MLWPGWPMLVLMLSISVILVCELVGMPVPENLEIPLGGKAMNCANTFGWGRAAS